MLMENRDTFDVNSVYDPIQRPQRCKKLFKNAKAELLFGDPLFWCTRDPFCVAGREKNAREVVEFRRER